MKTKSLIVSALAGVSILALTGCETLKGLNPYKPTTAAPTASAPAPAPAAPAYKNPFAVSVGGQKADIAGENFTKVAKPVAGDSAIEVDIKPQQDVIINIFKCEADGKNPENKADIILIPSKGTKGYLNKRMAKMGQSLPAGIYIMNVMGNGKTSRVLFEVK